MSKKADKFIFNDESVYNVYGFRIANEGISLSRFNANPVMMDHHSISSEAVIGRWENLAVETATLSGEPVFDMEDPKGKTIAGKVERGFIKSCSMGVLFNTDDMVRELNGKFLLTKCELFEVSIVAVPANANAVKLYVEQDGAIEMMSDSEVQLCLSGLPQQTNFENKNEKKNMKKVFLSIAALVALGLDNSNTADGVDSSEVEKAVNDLKSRLDNASLKLGATEAALKKFTDAEVARLNAEVDAFVAEVIPSKYDETERESVTKLAKVDLAFAKKIAATMPGKVVLGGKVNNPSPETPDNTEVKTMEDFQKLDDQAQLAFKAANPEAYKKIVADY